MNLDKEYLEGKVTKHGHETAEQSNRVEDTKDGGGRGLRTLENVNISKGKTESLQKTNNEKAFRSGTNLRRW